MRRHRIIFLITAFACAGCPASKKDVQTARRSLYDTDFTVVYNAALDSIREVYPNLEESAGRGSIKTMWHMVQYANNQDDLANPRVIAQGQGLVNTPGAAQSAAAGMPTRLAYKRYFIRFDVSITGGRPWRLKVIGHAAEWEPGAALPTELRGVARPTWLDGRTDALLMSIYKRVKTHAVVMKEEEEVDDSVAHTDPTAFKDVSPEAGKRLAAIKDALGERDHSGLRGQLADDVVWSLGGGVGADAAMALWQADLESFEAMSKAVAGGCGGDAKKVACPPGPPVAGNYQLVIEPRGDSWKITSFVRAE